MRFFIPDNHSSFVKIGRYMLLHKHHSYKSSQTSTKSKNENNVAMIAWLVEVLLPMSYNF